MAEKKYQCSMCDELHDRHDDAEECCQPEVEEVFLCSVCAEVYDIEIDADGCCAGIESPARCPQCHREYSVLNINQAAIEIAGHCRTCNPHFSYDQQFKIEDLHFARSESWESLNR